MNIREAADARHNNIRHYKAFRKISREATNRDVVNRMLIS